MNSFLEQQIKYFNVQYGFSEEIISKVLQNLRCQEIPDPTGSILISSLGVACLFTDPETALDFFAKGDLTNLFQKVNYFDHILNWGSLFCTLEELADVISSFVNFLEINREHIYKIGYPKTSFPDSAFFDVMLSKTYPVKFPIIEPKIIWLGEKPSYEIEYWGVEPPEMTPEVSEWCNAEPYGYRWCNGIAYKKMVPP